MAAPELRRRSRDAWALARRQHGLLTLVAVDRARLHRARDQAPRQEGPAAPGPSHRVRRGMGQAEHRAHPDGSGARVWPRRCSEPFERRRSLGHRASRRAARGDGPRSSPPPPSRCSCAPHDDLRGGGHRHPPTASPSPPPSGPSLTSRLASPYPASRLRSTPQTSATWSIPMLFAPPSRRGRGSAACPICAGCWGTRTFVLTDSELERMMLPLIRRAGLPLPQTGVELNGFKVDFFWPELGLVVETDGLRYHRTQAQQARTRSGTTLMSGPGCSRCASPTRRSLTTRRRSCERSRRRQSG